MLRQMMIAPSPSFFLEDSYCFALAMYIDLNPYKPKTSIVQVSVCVEEWVKKWMQTGYAIHISFWQYITGI